MSLIDDRELLSPWERDIPSSWKAPRIDDFCDVFFSNVDKHTIEGELPARLCNYVDVYKNEKITNKIEFMEASADAYELERFQIRKGDVLLTKDSEEPDDIAIASLVDEDLPGVICGYHLAMIRPRSRSINGSFLAWAHKSKPFRAQYEAKAVGITRFGLSQYAFRSARMPLPMADEQDRISTYLDKQCAAIDKVLEAKREQLTVLEELRKSIIHKAVTKGLDDSVEMKDSGIEWIGRVPKHWRIDRLKDVIPKILGGATPESAEPDYWLDGEIVWITPSDFSKLKDQRYISDSERKITQQGLASCATQLLPKGAVVMTSRASIGDAKISACELCTNQGFVSFVCEHFSNRFLAYSIDAYLGEFFNVIAPGTTFKEIGRTSVKKEQFAFPDLSEQEKIADYLDTRCKQLMTLKENIQKQIETLEKYRISLIHECVTGKRRITEKDLKELANV